MKNERLVYSTKDHLSVNQKEKWDMKNRLAASFSESEKDQNKNTDWKKGSHRTAERAKL